MFSTTRYFFHNAMSVTLKFYLSGDMSHFQSKLSKNLGHYRARVYLTLFKIYIGNPIRPLNPVSNKMSQLPSMPIVLAA